MFVPVSGPLTEAEEARLRILLEGDLHRDDTAEVLAIAGLAEGDFLDSMMGFKHKVFVDMGRKHHAQSPEWYPDPEPEHRREVDAVVEEVRRLRG